MNKAIKNMWMKPQKHVGKPMVLQMLEYDNKVWQVHVAVEKCDNGIHNHTISQPFGMGMYVNRGTTELFVFNLK